MKFLRRFALTVMLILPCAAFAGQQWLFSWGGMETNGPTPYFWLGTMTQQGQPNQFGAYTFTIQMQHAGTPNTGTARVFLDGPNVQFQTGPLSFNQDICSMHGKRFNNSIVGTIICKGSGVEPFSATVEETS